MRTNFFPVLLLFFLALSIGCSPDSEPPITSSFGTDTITPEDEVKEVIDNLLQISEYALAGSIPAAPLTKIFIRGKADGSIETETRATVKGVPQIIVRQTKGLKDKATLTQTKIFDSENDFKKNLPSLQRDTKVMGTTGGQILSILQRNITQEIQTFRSPIITVRPDFTIERKGLDDGSIQIIRRWTPTGEVRLNTVIYGLENGSVVTRNIYPDGSWVVVQVKGSADGSIIKSYTSGQP